MSDYPVGTPFPAPDQAYSATSISTKYKSPCRAQCSVCLGASTIQAVLFFGHLFMMPNKEKIPLRDVLCDFRKQFSKLKETMSTTKQRKNMYTCICIHMYSKKHLSGEF